jgi:hypothetical protein
MTKLKLFKTLKELERQIPQRLIAPDTIRMTRPELERYYNGLLGVDVPKRDLMVFHGYKIVEVPSEEMI